MTDDNPEEDDVQAALDLAEIARRQGDAVKILTLGDPRWSTDPCLIADALGDSLRLTLEYIVMKDGSRAPWALAFLAAIRDGVLALTDPAGLTRH
jgi:hypothetical protein